jgi:hypothetical protein
MEPGAAPRRPGGTLHGWSTMPIALHDIVQSHEAELVETLTQRLAAANAPHYRDLDPLILRLRCTRLIESFRSGLRGDPQPFVDFVRNMVQDRISEGFWLREVQLALTILEERAWKVAVDESTFASLVPNLGTITRTTGLAKDELARVYLAHAERADREVVDLQAKLTELFKGSQGYVASE